MTTSQCNVIFDIAGRIEKLPRYARDSPRVVVWSFP